MPKIKRNRLISSCKYCYEHKVKCDHGFPCSNCSKLNKSICIYNFQKSVNNRSDNNNQTTTNIDTLKQQNNKNLVLYTSNALFSYLGTSIKNLFVDNSIHNSFNPNINDILLGLNNDNDLTILIEILSKFPKNKKIMYYFNIYWDSIHSFIPVLHKSTIEEKLLILLDINANDKIDESIINSLDVPFLLILLSIFICSLIQESFKSNDENHIQLCIDEQRQYYEFYEKLLNYINFPQIPSIEAIQSSLIIFEVASFNYRNINVKVATLIRILLSIGINLKDDIDNNNPFFINVQHKRLIWNLTNRMDILSSIWMNTFNTADHFSKIVNIPKPNEFIDSNFENSNNLNVFISYNNMMYDLNSQLSKLFTYMSVDSDTNYFQNFDFQLFKLEMLAMYEKTYQWGNNIMKLSENNTIYDSSTNRWLIANTRILNLRIFILYKYCLNNISRRSSQTPPNKININIGHTNKNYKDSQSFITLLSMDKLYDSDLIEVVLILLYETRIRLTILKSTSKFKWNMRNANPFQFIFILLRDIYNQRNKRYDFSLLPNEIYKFCEFDLQKDQQNVDLRIIWVDEVIRLLKNFKLYWPISSQEVFELIVKLREFLDTSEGNKRVKLQIDCEFRKDLNLSNENQLNNLFDYQPLDLEYFKFFEM